MKWKTHIFLHEVKLKKKNTSMKMVAIEFNISDTHYMNDNLNEEYFQVNFQI